jgi:hypothetical protein
MKVLRIESVFPSGFSRSQRSRGQTRHGMRMVNVSIRAHGSANQVRHGRRNDKKRLVEPRTWPVTPQQPERASGQPTPSDGSSFVCWDPNALPPRTGNHCFIKLVHRRKIPASNYCDLGSGLM